MISPRTIYLDFNLRSLTNLSTKVMNFRTLLIVIFTFLMVSCQNGNQKKNSNNHTPDVVIAYENWSENRAFTTFVKSLLEDNGYVVKTVLVEKGYDALLEGKADVFLEKWESEDIYTETSGTLLNLGNLYENGRIGLVVPNYMDAQTIEDIEKFKKELDGKIYAVDSDFESFTGINVATQRYNFTLDITGVTEPEMIKIFEAKYMNREPFCITGWFPHPLLDQNYLRILEDPRHAFSKGYNLVKYSRRSWAKEHTELTDFFKKLKFSESQFKVLIDKVGESNWDIEKATAAWYKALSKDFKKLLK